jgi:uncharacterized GH25 family protein
LYQLKIEKPGAYLITAHIKPGFFTMTPDGRKWGDKKAVTNSVKCTNFHIQAKTVLIANSSDKNISGVAGQPLEIIPLTNPLQLKKDAPLAVKILFNGQPLSGAAVRATYAGFEADDMAPHKPPPKDKAASKGMKHPHKHFPVETVSNDQGQADLQLTKAGYWMIMLSHRSPYPETETCDEYMYNMAFTFEVKE